MSNSERKNMLDTHVKKTVDKITTYSGEWSEADKAFWSEMQPKVDAIYRKKRRRYAFIIFFGLVLIGATSLYFLQDNKIEEDQLLTEKNTIKEPTHNNSFSANNKIALNEIVELNEPENKLPITKPTISNPPINTPQKTSSLANVDIKPSNISSVNKNNIIPRKGTNNRYSEPKSTSILGKNQSNIQEIPSEIDANSGIFPERIQIQETSTNNSILYTKINAVNLKSPLIIMDHEPELIKVDLPVLNEIIFPKLSPKWEFGLGHSRFLINPFLNIPNTTPNESLTIALADKQYTSLDIIANRNFGKRLSFTTGLKFINQFVQLEYTVDDLPYTNDGMNVQNAFRSIIERNITPLTNNMLDNQLFIKLLPGKTLNEGDLINGIGIGDINLRIYEIPFQVNLHQRIGAFELVGFTGLSINWIQARIPRFDVELFVENDLISNDINFSPLSDQIVIPNIILGGGFRYHLNHRYRLHSFYNHNPLNSDFARIQFGLTYGIYK